MTPDEYCQNKAARPGSSIYYSLMPLSAQQRPALLALYAFGREIIAVLEECRETSVARVKLNWWREELNRWFAGQPQHPVSQALAVQRATFHWPPEYFQEVINGVEMDLDYGSYPSFAELNEHCQRVGGTFGLLAAQVLGYENPQTLEFAHRLGVALQLLHSLRQVRTAASRGRLYIPEDEMKRFGVSHADLLQPQTAESARELFKFQAERIRQHHRQALAQLPEQDRYAQRSLIILAELAMRLLDEIEADGYRILEHRISLTPLRKLWIAWRVKRRERRRQRRYVAIHSAKPWQRAHPH